MIYSQPRTACTAMIYLLRIQRPSSPSLDLSVAIEAFASSRVLKDFIDTRLYCPKGISISAL